jgi:DNA-binding response OmpR family regulator/EAL domain-containing protein (putative c-di-GMP-specific phosphodiesterase class I)
MTEQKNNFKRILIFDDDVELRQLLKVFLSKAFPDVELEEYDPIASGAPAEDFDWSKYDVLILDYFLLIHGVTGLDILQQNRKNPDFPATIMLTGAGNEEVAVRAIKAGVHEYLHKDRLDKNELQTAINSAFNKHNETKKQVQEFTLAGQAFNKALFYQNLEIQKDDPQYRERALLLLQLDHHEIIAKEVGIIFRDNAVRYIAKESFQRFKNTNSNPSITRLGDYLIALLIDMPDSSQKLQDLIGGLLEHLSLNPFKFDEKRLPFTVSVGIVELSRADLSGEKVLELAKEACASARTQEGNSFFVYGTEPVDTSENEPVDDRTLPDIKPPPAPIDETPTPKTLTEVKEELQNKAVPKEAVQKEAPDIPQVPEIVLDDSNINESGRQLKRAFEDKRVIQAYQPVISLLDEDMDSDEAIHYLTLRLIERDGSIKLEDNIRPQICTPEFKKFVDRWVIRDVIGTLANKEKVNQTFLIRISDASLADADFFNWIRGLLQGIDSKKLGQYVALELDIKDLETLEKQATALTSYLRKSNDFKFVLGSIEKAQDIVTYTSNILFDYIRCNFKVIEELQSIPYKNEGAESAENHLNHLKSKGTRFIADNVENATMLTDIINIGVDYAMGDFVGEAVTQFEDLTNIESFEIV